MTSLFKDLKNYSKTYPGVVNKMLQYINKDKFGVIVRDDLETTFIYILDESYVGLLHVLNVNESYETIIVYGNMHGIPIKPVIKTTFINLNGGSDKINSDKINIGLTNKLKPTNYEFKLISRSEYTILKFESGSRIVEIRKSIPQKKEFKYNQIQIPYKLQNIILNHRLDDEKIRPMYQKIGDLSLEQLKEFASIETLNVSPIRMLEILSNASIMPETLLYKLKLVKEKIALLEAEQNKEEPKDLRHCLGYHHNNRVIMVSLNTGESIDKVLKFIENIQNEAHTLDGLDFIIIEDKDTFNDGGRRGLLNYNLNKLKSSGVNVNVYKVDLGLLSKIILDGAECSFNILKNEAFNVEMLYKGINQEEVKPDSNVDYKFFADPQKGYFYIHGKELNTNLRIKIEESVKGTR